MPTPRASRGAILFAALGAIWGVPYLFIKVAVEHLSPPVVVFGRTAIGAALILPVAIRAGAIRPALAHWRPVLLFAVLEMAGPWLLLTHAEENLPSGLTGLLIACVPIVGAVIAFSLGDTSALHPRRLAGIAVGIGGVVLLVLTDLSGNGTPVTSVVEVLVVCVCYAIAPFVVNRRLGHVSSSGVIAVSLSVVAVGYLPAAIATWPDGDVPATAWWAVVGLGVICTGLAFVVFFALLAAIGPARSTLITFVNPAVALLVGSVFLDEEITPAAVGGFAAVLTGCWLAATRPAEPHLAPATD